MADPHGRAVSMGTRRISRADKAWAPFVQARTAGSPGEPRTCDQLGVCQNLRPRCRACPEYLDAAELDAPLTPFEQIGYWAALGSLVVASVAVVADAAGWVYATYF